MSLDNKNTDPSLRNAVEVTSMSDHVVDNVDIDTIVSTGSTSLTTLNGLSAQKVKVQSGEELERILDGHSVDEITKVIESIIADKSVKKDVRRQAVGRVVDNQPHPTSEFHQFDTQNQSIVKSVRQKNYISDYDFFCLGAGMSSVSSLIVVFSVIMLVVSGYEPEGVGAVVSFSLVSAVSAAASHFAYKAYRKELSGAYGEREHMTLDEFKAHQIEVAQKEMEEQRQQHQKTMEALGAVVGEGGSTVSLTQVKQDFSEVKLRISEYETDLTKALSRPAFNDVNVPAVNTMVLQLRKCKRMFEDTSVHSVADIGDSVDKLWVDFTAAEQAAKKIAWSEVGEEEQKDLKLALQLVSQANDPGNTDAMRTNLYSRLRKIVNRLDSGGVTIHARVIEQIESKARLEVERPQSEQVHAV